MMVALQVGKSLSENMFPQVKQRFSARNAVEGAQTVTLDKLKKPEKPTVAPGQYF